jgi:hypothetical protein
MYFICYDCDKLLEDYFECSGCNIIRCRFHHFVNSEYGICIECQYNIVINDHVIDKMLYKCKYCNSYAYHGYIDDIILCSLHSNERECTDIIYFGQYCKYAEKSKKCIGSGWYRDKTNNKLYCTKHKNENCAYNFNFIKN